MKRLFTLIAGGVAGVLLALGGLYLLTLVWPGLFRAGATTPTPIAAAVTPTPEPSVTPAAAATATPNSAPVATESPLLRPVVTVTSAAPRPAGGNGLLPITRLDLQRVYEAQGFDFQLSQLGDDQEHWVAASPDQLALVEIVGAEAAEHASVTVFGPVHGQAEGGPQRAVYMLTMLNAVLPGWASGAQWFSDELVNMAQAPGDFQAATTQAGVRVQLSQDAQLGAIILSFEPEKAPPL